MTEKEFVIECRKIGGNPMTLGTTRIHFIEVKIGSRSLMISAEWTSDMKLECEKTLEKVKKEISSRNI